ncbi:hypothetical protein AcW1_001703 [Taiwanofungus camphoratus]|nr:hypothetical protein AcV7_001562 [Antrodia cinnamomea]KAI0945489.1 hypothetical protein AcW1_001703 [Antrodia cinnamomea]
MLADVQHRIPYMRVLHLKHFPDWLDRRDHISADYMLSLTEVLQHATNLKEIHLQDIDDLLEKFPSFVDALAALPRLDVIHLVEPHRPAFQLLSRMTSCPHELRIKGSDRAQLGDRQAFEAAVSSQIFSQSLRIVDLKLCGDLIDKLDVDNTYRSLVHVLKINDPVVHLPTLVRIFPNLHSLQFSGTVSYGRTPPSATWPNLDHLVIDGRQDFPCCLVRRLEITYLLSRALIPKILPMLQRMSPVVLSLPIFDSGFAELSQLANAVPTLRYLQLERASPNESWVINVVAAIGTLPLDALSIWADIRCPTVHQNRLSRLIKALVVGIASVEYVEMGSKDYFSKTSTNTKTSSTWYHVVSRVYHNGPIIREIREGERWKIEKQLLNMPRL